MADRILVLRRGRKVAEKPIAGQFAGGGHRPDHRRDRCRLSLARQKRAMATVGIGGTKARQSPFVRRWLVAQPFWVTIAVAADVRGDELARSPMRSDQRENFYNITRNFAFIGIMALGMTTVIITGGIDLSVGSVMGLAAIVCRPGAAGRRIRGGWRWLAGLGAGRALPARSTAC